MTAVALVAGVLALAPGDARAQGQDPVLSVASASLAEAAAEMEFAVSLSAASTEAVTVGYATSDGTATAGADYISARGVLTFAAGETSKTVSVAVLADSVDEADETFTLTFSGALNASLDGGGVTLAVAGTIVDDDSSPVFADASVERAVAENSAAGADVGASLAAASDADGDALAYTMGGADAGSFDFDASTRQITVKAGTALDYEAAKNTYTVTVAASDGANTGAVAVNISVTDVNEAPTFTSAAAVDVPENTTAVVTVVASDADSADSVTGYAISGGADASWFAITSGGALSFSAAPDFESPADAESADPANAAANNEYVVEVTATSGTGDREKTAAQTIVVTVTDVDESAVLADAEDGDDGDVNEAPVFTSAAAVDVPENTTAVVTVAASDADAADSVTGYAVSGGADASRFAITSGGALSFSAAPDFESPADALSADPANAAANNQYVVEVTATSGTGDREKTAAQTIVVTVTDVDEAAVLADAEDGEDGDDGDVNEAPVFTSAAAVDVPENTTAVVTVAASDADAADSVTGYAISGGADASRFEITSPGGALSFSAAPDFESPSDAESADPANAAADNEYVVEVTVTSGTGDRQRTAAQTIVVTVIDVNEAPVFTSAAAVDVPENTTAVLTVAASDADSADVVTGYAVSGGVDSSRFEITSPGGVLSFSAAPDFESPSDAESADPANAAANNEYVVEVTATSGGGHSWDGGGVGARVRTVAQTIVVTVTDADDAGSVTFGSAAPRVGAALTATLADDDAVTGSVAWTWARCSSGECRIQDRTELSGAAGSGTSSTYTPVAADAGMWLRAQAGYSDSLTSGAAAGGVTAAPVAAADAGAAFDAGDNARREIVGAAAEGADVGAAFTVSAPAGAALAFALSGGGGNFEVVDEGGAAQIKVAPGAALDHDTTPGHTVTLTVSDGLANNGPNANAVDDTITVTITVTAADPDAPTFYGGANAAPVFSSAASVSVVENTTAVLTVTASDADSADSIASYAVTGGADQSKFQITSPGGVLSFKAAPDFESPTDVLSSTPANTAHNNEYVVVVTATSGAGAREMTAAQTIVVTVTDERGDTPVVQAHTFDAKSGGVAINDAAPDYSSIGSIGAGDWVRFDGIDLSGGPDVVMVVLSAAAADAGDKIEVRVDSASGTKIAELTIADTGGRTMFSEQYADVSGASGSNRSVYLVFPSATGANVNWFAFGEDLDDKSDDVLERERLARIKWWRDARFGMFIHWGPYSHLANRSGCRTGDEWMMYWCRISVAEYERDAVAPFNPSSVNVVDWARVAKEAGQKYVVITSKHHDGFAMYDTNVRGMESHTLSPVRDYDIVENIGRDPIAELAAAVRAQGLTFGLYYSHGMDWHWKPRDASRTPAQDAAYVSAMKEQLREIIEKYDPALLWFDGEWNAQGGIWTRPLGEALERYLRILSPDVVVNDRIIKRKFLELVDGDYDSTAEQSPPYNDTVSDWENALTTNNSWGFDTSDTGWKTADFLIETLVENTSNNGNLLLNVGPDAAGAIPKANKDVFKEVGEWLAVYGEAIYSTDKPNPLKEADPSWGWYTTKGATVYAFVEDWPSSGVLELEGLRAKVTSVTVVGSNPVAAYEARTVTSSGRVVVSGLPTTAPDSPLSVLKVLTAGGIGVEGPPRSLVYKRPVTATSQHSGHFGGFKAIDQDESTEWVAADDVTAGDTVVLTVDLDGSQTFDRVEIKEPHHTKRVRNYKVQYYDGTAWTDVATGTRINQKVHTFNPVTATRVRLNITGSVIPIISEFQVWNDAGTNLAPKFTLTPEVDVVENTTAVTTVAATDADRADTVTGYAITGGADRSKFQITSPGGVLSFKTAPALGSPTDVLSTDPPNAAANNEYVVKVTATSGTGSRKKTTTQTIIVTVIKLVVRRNLSLNETVTVSNRFSAGFDGDKAVDGDDSTRWATRGVTTATLDVEFDGPQTFDRVVIKEPSQSNLQRVTGFQVQYWDGSAWVTVHTGTTIGNSRTITFDAVIATKVRLSITGARSDPTIAEFQVWGEGGVPNAAPVFSSAASVSVAENTTAVVTVAASDADSADSITGYAITGGADRSKFQITSPGGVLSFKAAPDFESPTDVLSTSPANAAANNEYVVEVTATGGTGGRAMTAAQTITVTVTDANEAPAFTSSAAVSVVENTTAVVTVAASDDDPADSVTGYAITGGADRSKFQITSPGGVLTFRSAPDFESPGDVLSSSPANAAANNEYVVVVTATGGAGGRAMSAAQTIVVTVTDANEAPAFTSSAAVSVVENTTAVVTVAASDVDSADSIASYAITGGADRAKFTITSPGGVLAFAAAPDFEDPGDVLSSDPANAANNNQYVVEVTATAGAGGRAMTAVQTIVVTVTDSNEVPTFTSSAAVDVVENTTAVVTVAASDDDPADSVTGYAVTGGADRSKFTITTGGALSFAAAPDFEDPGDVLSSSPSNAANNNEYVVEVTATSGGVGRVMTAAQTIVVTVTDANEAPAFTSSAAVSVVENTTAVLTVAASDADAADSVTGYAVTGGADRSKFTITTGGALSFAAAPDFEDPGDVLSSSPSNAATNNEYVVVVTATAGAGGRAMSAAQTITVTVTDANEVPAFTSSAAVSVVENTTAVVTVAASDDDPADSVTSYAITGGADRAKFTITSPGGALVFAAAPDFEDPGDVLSSSPANAATNNEYVVEVTATSGTDARVMTTAQTIVVTVTDANEAPAFTSSAAVDVVENTTAVVTVAATDADSADSVTGYAITGGADRAKFTITTPGGVLAFAAAPDFEDPDDASSSDPSNAAANNEYVVEVTATSGGAGRVMTTAQTIVVTVTDSNEAPVFTSSAAVSMAENTTAVATVAASDVDADDSVTGYAITGGADRAKFQITSPGGVLTFRLAPDFESPGDVLSSSPANAAANNEYVVVVTATSGGVGRVMTAAQTIVVTVTDANEAPAFTSSAAVSVVENTTAVLTVAASDIDADDSVTGYAITGGADSSKFTITSPGGVLVFAAAPDFEDPDDASSADPANAAANNEYVVVVTATSGGVGRVMTTAQTIVVTVTDANEAPAFTSSAAVSVVENTTAVVTVAASDIDADDSVTGYAVTGGADRSKFQITSPGGVLTFRSAPDFESPGDVLSSDPSNAAANNEYVVEVTATSGGVGRVMSTAQTIVVTVTDVNEAPVFTSSAAVDVAENTTAVVTVAASDIDSADSVTGYTVSGGADSSKFTITSPGGVLVFAAAPDFEDPGDVLSSDPANAAANNEYVVEVTATSGGVGRVMSTAQTITVTVTDANEAPVFTSAAAVSVAENTTAVVTVAASDIDADDGVTGYTITGGADRAKFTITSPGGVLAFAAAPDFEDPDDAASSDPANAAANNEYVVEVTATSGGVGRVMTTAQTITVTVTDANEAAEFTSAAAVSVAENTTAVLTVAASDDDPADSVTGYAITGGADRAKFTITSPGGVLVFAAAPDFEDPGDVLSSDPANAAANNEYVVEVTATSGTDARVMSTAQTITVTVTDANEAPVFTSAAAVSVAENTTAVLTVAASDIDSADSVTGYTVSGGADSSKFTITSPGGVLVFAAAPDFEDPGDVLSSDPSNAAANNEYVVEVTATSGGVGRVMTTAQTITVTVTDANEAPVFTSAAAVDVAENTTAVVTVAASDIDSADSVTGYAISGGADRAKFTITSPGGVLVFAAAPDFESPTDVASGDPANAAANNEYVVEVTATSGGVGRVMTTAQTITVTVTDANEAPEFTSSAAVSVPENTTAVLTVAASDIDSADSVTGYAISGGADSSRFTITSPGGVLVFAAAPDFEDPDDVASGDPANAAANNEYVVVVTATGGAGGRVMTTAQTIVVTVTDVNEAPTFTSSAAVSVAENTTAVVTVAASDIDSTDSIASYAITGGADSSKFEITSPGGALTFAAAPDFESPGDVLSTSPANAAANNQYVVVVTATGGAGGRAMMTAQTIAVTVTDANEAPTFTSSAAVSVAENTTAVVTVAASDIDSADSVTGYAVTGGADRAKFTITSPGGALTFRSAPDFEDPGDVASADPANAADNNQYVVEVTATGGAGGRALTTAQTIVVTVTDVNEAPTFTSSAAVDVAENTTAVVTVAASDVDSADSVTGYAITGGADSSKFEITASGVLTFAAAPDFEDPGDVLSSSPSNAAANNEYVVEVTATGGAGGRAMMTAQTIVVTVTDANEVPTFTSSAAVSVAENTTAVVTVAASDIDSADSIASYAITGGADSSKFTITSPGGALSFAAAPDFESPTDVASSSPSNAAGDNEYVVEVTATGGTEGRALTTAQTIVVTVTDANEAPTFTSSAAVSVAENTTAVVTVAATDVDSADSVTGYAITGGADSSRFEITSPGGALTFRSAPDFESPTDVASSSPSNAAANNEYVVVVTATAGAGGRALTTAQTIVVTVIDANEAPTFTSSAAVSVAENTTAVVTVAASDIDSTDSIASYAVTGGADSSKFTITSPGGALSFAAAPDFEDPGDAASSDPANAATNNQYVVVVTATGGAGGRALTTAQTIVVTVTDANEAPTFTSAATASVAENTTAVATVAASDVDSADSVTGYAITGGADRAKFEITSPGGVLTFAAAPDFEDPGDVASSSPSNAAANNEYVVEVTATGGAGGRAMTTAQTITVTVTDVNEAPTFTSSAAVSVAENTTAVVTVAASDIDSADSIASYAISGGADRAKFEITSPGGVLTFAAAPDFESPDDVLSTSPANAATNNQYVVVVTATGGTGGRAMTTAQTITVTVTDANEAPTFTSSAAVSVAENTTAVVTVAASDVDSADSVTGYAITGGADSSKFTITTGGALRFAAAPDFEDPGDAASSDPANAATNNQYVVVVTATGGAGGRAMTTAQTITVTVTDVNEAPTFTSSAAVSVAENTTAVLTVEASDIDSTDSIASYAITSGADSSKFEITSPGGALTFAAAPDFEDPGDVLSTSPSNPATNNQYVVVVTATGGAGGRAMTTAQTITVTVTDANEAPTFTSSAAVSVAENTTAVVTVEAADIDADDSITGYTVSGGADSSKFEITSPGGVLAFAAAPDFEDPDDAASADPANAAGDNEYVVEVTATSGGAGRVMTTAQTIVVTVTDVNEAPVFTSAAAVDVVENTTAVLTVEATDIDSADSITGYTLTGGADSSKFTITSGGVLTFRAAPDFDSPTDVLSSSPSNAAGDNEYVVEVTATGGAGGRALTTAQTIVVTVTDSNEAPVFTSDAAVSVPENETAVATVEASDLDADDSVTGYEITGGADASRFAITSGGVLAFRSAPDFESPTDVLSSSPSNAAGDNEYVVVVTATGGTGGRAMTTAQTITVTVTDVRELRVAGASVVEAAADMEFTVTMAPVSGRAVEVAYATSGGTAAAGADYTAAAGTLVFAAGETSKTVAVAVLEDSLDEDTETVVLRLSAPTGASLEGGGATLDATGSIVDDDPLPELSASSPSVVEGDSGATTLSFTVTLSPVSGRAVEVAYATSDGTAAAGADYTAAAGTLVFAAGETSKTVAVAVLEDSLDEDVETVVLRLSAPVNATLQGGGATLDATGSIVDDDPLPELSASSPSVVEGDSGAATLSFTVTLSPVSGRTVTVAYADTGAGSAALGSDYSAVTAGTLVFAAGETTREVPVPVLGDGLAESTETVVLRLSAPVNATLEGGGAILDATGSIVDDEQANNPPSFPLSVAARRVAENSPAGANVGGALPAAVDAEGDTLVYAMGSADAGSFDFDAATRQITVAAGAGLDHESRSRYTVSVSVHDARSPSGAASAAVDDTITVSIWIVNVDEPGAVELSSVQPQAGAEFTASVSDLDGDPAGVTWAWARSADGTTWSSIPEADSADYTPTDDDAGSYLRAVAAYSDPHGAGKAAAAVTANQVRAEPDTNSPPVFGDGASTSREIAENSVPGTDIGLPLAADDPDGDALSYSLSGRDAQHFEISAAGQITVGPAAALNHESRSRYTVTATVADPSNSTDTIRVTIIVADVDGEAPSKPAPPQVAARAPTSLRLLWAEPPNPGPRIVRYEVQHRPDGAGAWTQTTASATSRTIGGLDPGAVHQLRVRAVNAEGEGDWSDTVSASTRQVLNRRPEFPAPAVERSIKENLPAGSDVGAAVTADDPDGDTVAYTLTGSRSFTVDASTGQINTTAALSHETRSTHTVTVTATDGTLTATARVTITVHDTEEPGSVTLSAPPRAATAATAWLADPDGNVSDLSWAWHISTDSTDWSPIPEADGATYTPTEADAGSHLRATATYTDRRGPDKTAHSTPHQVLPAPADDDAATLATLFTLRRDVHGDVTLVVGPGASAPAGTTVILPKAVADRLAPRLPAPTVHIQDADTADTATRPTLTVAAGAAVVDISGIKLLPGETLTVCLPARPRETAILRYNALTQRWVQLTNARTATRGGIRLVCGQTDSLSPFAAAVRPSIPRGGAGPPEPATPFTDLDAAAPVHRDDIARIHELGITAGTTPTTYTPGAPVTRAQMATFLARLHRVLTGRAAPVRATPFTDLDAASVHRDDIARIHGLGVTAGTTPTTYTPGAPVTRAQMATFLARLHRVLTGRAAPVRATPFTDLDAASVHRDDIARIHGLGVTAGTTPTTYTPGAPVTRAQMATFLARLHRVLTGRAAPVRATPTTPVPSRGTRPPTTSSRPWPHIYNESLTQDTGRLVGYR